VRESLGEFRKAIRDKVRRFLLQANCPLWLFRVYGTGRRNGGIAPFVFRENAARD
jgi:hypothetical protein